MNRCIEMNLEILDKIRDLLCSIDPAGYQQSHASFFDSSIGGHVRHILDYYERFFDRDGDGVIDYSRRKRDGSIETEPASAIGALDKVKGLIGAVADGPVTVVSDSGESFVSSFGRELEFLAGHAVHHNAMIVAMSQFQGVTVSAEMAFAQSTLDYQASA